MKGLLISRPQNQHPNFGGLPPRGKTTWQHATIRSILTNTTEDETRIKELERSLDTLTYRISKTTISEELCALHDEYTHTLDSFTVEQKTGRSFDTLRP